MYNNYIHIQSKNPIYTAFSSEMNNENAKEYNDEEVSKGYSFIFVSDCKKKDNIKNVLKEEKYFNS